MRPYHERLRAELERWGGTVEKFIGDAVVAVFGAPIAREDDPERALRAALAIRDWAMEEDGVEVRIAVNTGEALVSLDARPDSGEGFIAGDVVNTASRLQSAAPVNGILVGEQTQRATNHVIDYGDADPVVAKGKSEPIAVWEALQARSRFGVDVRQHGGAALVGRASRAQLAGRVARARAAGARAAAGHARRRAGHRQEPARLGAVRDDRARRRARVLATGTLAPVRRGSELLGDRGDGEGPGRHPRGRHGRSRRRELGRAVRRRRRRRARLGGGPLRPLVGETELDAGASNRDESFTAWRTFFEALAERRPLVLVFEDIHWADEGLLDFIDHLADWSSGVPLLVLCTARPELFERRPGWGGGKLNALTLALSPLSNDDTSTLLSLVLARTVLAAEIQQALLERAGGNPLYAEQFARLSSSAARWTTCRSRRSAGPDRGTRRLLPAEEKALLQDAAVMGKVFWSGALPSTARFCERLHALERKEFIRRERRSSVTGQESSPFATRSFATSRMGRSHAPTAPKHLGPRAGSKRSAARRITPSCSPATISRRSSTIDRAIWCPARSATAL